ncbi:hypothetical protein [Natrialba sp. INN-245]|uniref:hypothetical protein n=1 Tax=Natrialba sp. INN-245 TaxID=2690967 RepID=UPI0013120845|nr:hypothetical protein [Natrialba sp. INN-245]MWV40248.1 hypothetical protein [Natrialba sp. INN-245]
MPETIRVGRKELTSREVLRELKDGNRVIVEVNVLGTTMNMALRRHAGTYYCDTPLKLLTYETDEEMQTCLERYRLATPDSATPTEETGSSPSAKE